MPHGTSVFTPRTRRVRALEHRGRRRRLAHTCSGAVEREVDEGAVTAALGPLERRERGERRHGGGVERGVMASSFQRGEVGSTRRTRGQEPPTRPVDQGQLARRVVSVRPHRSEGGHGTDDKARCGAGQRLVVQPGSSSGGRAQVMHNDVGASCEGVHPTRHGTLVGVEPAMSLKRASTYRVEAVARLHAHHVSTEIGEQLGDIRRRHPTSHLKHANTRKPTTLRHLIPQLRPHDPGNFRVSHLASSSTAAPRLRPSRETCRCHTPDRSPWPRSERRSGRRPCCSSPVTSGSTMWLKRSIRAPDPQIGAPRYEPLIGEERILTVHGHGRLGAASQSRTCHGPLRARAEWPSPHGCAAAPDPECRFRTVGE